MNDNLRIEQILIDIGKMVKSLRENQNLTQSELAEKVTLGRNTIQKLEYGKNSNLLSLLMVLRYFELEQEFYQKMKDLMEVPDIPDSLY